MKKFLLSILFIFIIGFLFSFSVQEARAISASTSVSVSGDDAWEDVDNALGGGYGKMDTTGSYTRTKEYSNPEPDEVFEAGFRWVISIPKGSTITEAYAQFYVYDTLYDNIMDEIRWYFQDGTGSPPSFSSAAYNISSRSKTSNYMVWQQTSIPVGWVTTPSLVQPLQEIVTGYDVSALVLFNESSYNAGSSELRVRTRDYGSTNAARFYVTYTLPPPSVVIPVVTTDIADIASVDLSTNQATLKGTVTNTGGANPSQRVLEWGTSTGSYTQSYDSGAGATGTFAYTITLTPGTIYYYRAKAYNSAGWGYGAERRTVIFTAPGGQRSFTTTAATTTLTLNKNIAAGGTATSSPAGINCGTACSTQTATFASGTSVVLTPTAASGYTFSSWTGCTSVTGNNCNVTMNVNKTVTATFSLNSRPYVSSVTLSGSPAYCNILPGVGQVSFEWVYNDNDGDNQSHYHFQVATDASFSSKIVDCSDIPESVLPGGKSTKTVRVVPSPSTDCSLGKFEISYLGLSNYWRVRVRAATGNPAWSDWVEGSPNFTTPSHAYPWTMFAPSPSKPAANQEVKFIQDGLDFITDLSLCYSGGEGLCQSKPTPPTSYSWDFGNGQSSSYKGNATTTYSAAGTYNVTLTITDDVGFCSKTKTVTIGPSLPNWYEVPPF